MHDIDNKEKLQKYMIMIQQNGTNKVVFIPKHAYEVPSLGSSVSSNHGFYCPIYTSEIVSDGLGMSSDYPNRCSPYINYAMAPVKNKACQLGGSWTQV